MRGANIGLDEGGLRRWDVRAWDHVANEFRRRYYEAAVFAAREQVERRASIIEQFFRGTKESPLEEMLGQHLLLYIFNAVNPSRRILGSNLTHDEVVQRHLALTVFLPGFDPLSLSICAQMHWPPYQADFCIVATHARSPEECHLLVLECDGHSTHAADPEQLQRDARRDAWMEQHGAAVLRFPHADIFNNPWHCAARVAATIGIPEGLFAQSPRHWFSTMPEASGGESIA